MVKEYKDQQQKKGQSILEEPLIKYPAIQLDDHKRYTYADYLTWMDNIRRELINGFVHTLSAPLRVHAEITSNLLTFFNRYTKNKKGNCKAYHAPFDVRLPSNRTTADNKIYTVVQPDICVVCDPEKLDGRGCIGAPDLIVEVLSPSTGKRDLNEKFNLYEVSGVKEYWVVYPDSQAMNVFILQPDGKYDSGMTYEKKDKVPVHIFKGLNIDMEELFAD